MLSVLGHGKDEMLAVHLLKKWRNWYQNEVDDEIKGVDSRDMVKHTERSNR